MLFSFSFSIRKLIIEFIYFRLPSVTKEILDMVYKNSTKKLKRIIYLWDDPVHAVRLHLLQKKKKKKKKTQPFYPQYFSLKQVSSLLRRGYGPYQALKTRISMPHKDTALYSLLKLPKLTVEQVADAGMDVLGFQVCSEDFFVSFFFFFFFLFFLLWFFVNDWLFP